MKTLNDSIEASGLVFDNDKKVVPRFNRVYIDPSNPRVELTFTQTGWNGIFDKEDEYNDFLEGCQRCTRYRNGSCSILKKALENKIQEEISFDEDTLMYSCNKRKEKKI